MDNGIAGISPAGIEDWFEEHFGGVVGCIAEMFLEMSKGSSISQYMSCLSGRINKVIVSTSERKHISPQQLSDYWLKDIKSDENDWNCMYDAGLCGSSPPRGVIFSFILKRLCIYVPEEDLLSLVNFFRSTFLFDPGLDGCLLELEEIH